jgi:AcrR family transcriptional regulator
VSTVDRRAALLDAAVAEIAHSGAGGFRVEAVAKSAGVSTSLLYRHFGDRATLLLCALERVGARADDYTVPQAGIGREMVMAMLLGEIQNDERVRLNSAAWGALRETAMFDLTLRPTLTRLTQRWITDVALFVGQGVADGTIQDGLDSLALGTQLTAAVEGISGRWLTDQLTTEQARAHLGALVDALLGPRPRPMPLEAAYWHHVE